MGYWNSRGLRGSALENIINLTNDVYRRKNLAIIQKVPTPITPVKFDKETKNITLAYFEKKSTVDYIGVVQGVAVCFDVKETKLKNLPLQNIHKHQVEFMESFVAQQGMAFLVVYFSKYDEYYYLPFAQLKEHLNKSQKGAKKHIPYEDFDKELLITVKDGFYVHYLEVLAKVAADS